MTEALAVVGDQRSRVRGRLIGSCVLVFVLTLAITLAWGEPPVAPPTSSTRVHSSVDGSVSTVVPAPDGSVEAPPTDDTAAVVDTAAPTDTELTVPESSVPAIPDPPDKGVDRRALAAGRQVWSQKKPAHFTYYTQTGCFCALTDILVEVRNGTIVSAKEAGVRDRPVSSALSIEQMFDIADTVITQNEYYAVSFDPVWGFPATISTQGGSSGDQMTYIVTLFSVAR